MMYLDKSMRETDLWTDVGVHPTPADLADSFAEFVASHVSVPRGTRRAVRLLDAFAGDGRLGHAVANALTKKGILVELHCAEVARSAVARIPKNGSGYKVRTLQGDVFSTLEETFDLVVSNPPYLSMNRATTEAFGFDWEIAKGFGANLYCLAIRKCLELTTPEGHAFVLAPYGWINNRRCHGLRAYVAKWASSIDVLAFDDRNLFPNVSQDIGFQAFLRRDKPALRKKIPHIMFSHGDEESRQAKLHTRKRSSQGARARVGPLVWNRCRDMLRSDPAAGFPIVNGGNIRHDGTLDFDLPRYRDRQYAANSCVPASFVSTGPMLLLKRTMRGAPGAWSIDAALILDDSFKCIAENHVIVVTLDTMSKQSASAYTTRLISRILWSHRLHGHPNISAQIVSQAMDWMRRMKRPV